MFSSPTKFLIILLALLQFAAPLVHAHTGEEHSNLSIHLPGLEHFITNSDSTSVQAQTTHCKDDACSTIGVGSAIKHKKAFTDNINPYYFAAVIFSINSVSQPFFIAPSLGKQVHISTAHYTLLPSRAPPHNL